MMNAELIGMIISDSTEIVSSTLDNLKTLLPNCDPFYISSLVPDSIMCLKMEMIAALIFQGEEGKP